MHWRSALLTVAFGVVCFTRLSSADAPAAKPLVPVPPVAERTKADKTIHELFKDEFKRQDPASRRALAAKLLTQGSQGDSLASQYVLLQDATDLAAGAGDVAGAFRAVDAMALIFTVDTIDLKAAVLTTASRVAAKPADAAALAEASLTLADDAVTAGRFEAATKLSAQAETDAKAAKDVGLYNKAHARADEIQAASHLAQKFKAANERLKEHPEDPAANLAVGKYLSLVKGDWDAALPYLSRGADNALATVARQDLANPADAKAQVSLADAWWDLSQDPKAGFKGAAKRAGIWYHKAMPSLTGLQKAAAQKRLLASGRSTSGAHLTIFKFVMTDNTCAFRQPRVP